MKLNALLSLTLLSAISVLGAQEATIVDENPATQWITTQLKAKDTPEWVKKYILALDDKIQDESAKAFYRRFLYDSNTRSDSITKFAEYLSLNESQKDLTPSIYKAIYFALTYTIMDGLPTGPLRPKQTELHGGETIHLSSTAEDKGEMKKLANHTRISDTHEAKQQWVPDQSYSGSIRTKSAETKAPLYASGTGSDVVNQPYEKSTAFKPHAKTSSAPLPKSK